MPVVMRWDLTVRLPTWPVSTPAPRRTSCPPGQAPCVIHGLGFKGAWTGDGTSAGQTGLPWTSRTGTRTGSSGAASVLTTGVGGGETVTAVLIKTSSA